MCSVPLNLLELFNDVPDPRLDRRKLHSLHEILTLAVLAMLAGAENFTDMEDFGNAKAAWLRTFLALEHGIPSHDTFNRVFQALKPEAFLDCFLRWTQSLRREVAQEIVALDGKALRRALNRGQSLPYIVSAWASSNRLVLGQLKVADKSNEITALPPLLRQLELAGCLVTVDALGCQKKIAKEIKESDADYVMALKGNHETVHAEVKRFLDDAIARQEVQVVSLETVEKDHGRLEIRRWYLSDDLDWFADKGQWEGLRTMGLVETVRQVGDQPPTTERRYFLGSIAKDIEAFARATREHWGVENPVHWVLDVLFGEDLSRARTGHAPENLATLRRLALNLLRRDPGTQRSLRRQRKAAGWNDSYLRQLLGI